MATLSLQKGQNISLDKADPGLNKILVGLGWDPRATAGQEFDLDASALLLDASGKVRSNDDFVFYNQLGDVAIDGGPGRPRIADEARASVIHAGDNRTGDGDGDDEVIFVDLSRVPADIVKIVFAVTIHDATARGQNFGQVDNAFIRLVNNETGVEVTRYDLNEDAGIETAMNFGEIYRHNGEWKFRAIGAGHTDGLAGIARQFGVQI